MGTGHILRMAPDERGTRGVHEKLKIVKYPQPVLRRKCEPVVLKDSAGNESRKALETLVRRMGELLLEHAGVGLAAPQVGVAQQLFIVNLTGEPGKEKAYVNPELVNLSEQEEADEGCLSIPGVTVPVRRATQVTLRATDLEGRLFEEKGEDLLARVFQHESDHVNGRLILDYMTPESKLVNRRAIQELQAEYDREHKARKKKATPPRKKRASARKTSRK